MLMTRIDSLPCPERARRSDADTLAQLIVQAGDGLPLTLWETLRAPGETVWDVGRRRAARDQGGFSWRKADVVRHHGAVISAMVSYPLTEVTDPADIAAAPALFRPLLDLENRVVPSWYINVLATAPDYQRLGAATALLRRAETRARAARFGRLSLVTGDINPARRLYERFGFVAIARAPIVKEGWDYDGTTWMLYEKVL